MRHTVVGRLAGLASGVATALCVASAGAQTVEPATMGETPATTSETTPATTSEAPRTESGLHPRTGVEVSVVTGAGGHINDSSTAFRDVPQAQDHLFWPGFGVQMWTGYRFLPWLSMGGHFAFQNNPSRDLPPGTTAGVANSVSAGVYARVYVGSAIGWRRIDPWISVGVNPFSTLWADHQTPIGGTRARIAAVGIPVSVGLDYNFTPWLAAGLTFQASPWIPFEACQNAPGGQISACSSNNLATNTYFFAGVGVRATLPQL